MATTSADIAALPDYTDAELLKLYRWGLANNAAGQSRMMNGRSVTFPGVKDMLAVIDKLEERTSADENGGFALVTLNETS